MRGNQDLIVVEKLDFNFENNRYLILDNVYFILEFTINSIYVSRLYEQCYKVLFNNNSDIIHKN